MQCGECACAQRRWRLQCDATQRRPHSETSTRAKNKNNNGFARTLAHRGGRVGARRAGLLLNVERAATAATAQRVRLVQALTERLSTLGLRGC